MPLIDGSSGDHTKVHDYKRAEISDGSVREKTVGKFAMLSLKPGIYKATIVFV